MRHKTVPFNSLLSLLVLVFLVVIVQSTFVACQDTSVSIVVLSKVNIAKANTAFKPILIQVVTDMGEPVYKQDVYLFPEPNSKLRPYFNPSVVTTNTTGYATVNAISGFSVGSGYAIASLVNRTVYNANVVYAQIPIKVEQSVSVQSWVQVSIILFFSLLSIMGSLLLAKYVLNKEEGTVEMKNVANPIKEGAHGFLRTQYMTIALMAIPLSIALYIMYATRVRSSNDPDIRSSVIAFIVSLSFLLGVFFSALSGFIGMFVSVRANVRVTNAATRSYNEALSVATFSGAFAGFLVVSLSAFGVCFLFTLLYACIPPQLAEPQQIVGMIVGFSFGCSLSALFAQLGGGIFTKAADVGADLVGKVEKNIPEDDVRNPAVIADLVGDNVGDCAGRGSDLFESISAENLGVMILSGSLCANAYPQISTPISYIVFPLIVHVCGMIGSWIGIFFVRVRDLSEIQAKKSEDEYSLLGQLTVEEPSGDQLLDTGENAQTEDSSGSREDRADLKLADLDNPMAALNVGFVISSLITTLLFVLACVWLLRTPQYPAAWYHFCFCGLIGIATSWAFVIITVYYTDYSWSPVKSIVNASKTGAATNVISGIAVGLESTSAPVIVISIAILSSYYIGRESGIVNELGEKIGGLFGIAIATIGMLSCSSYILTMDTLGPIVDNAGGIAEMSGLPRNIRLITDRLDAVGNTTKALTKGYAIGSASLAAFLLFAAYLDTIGNYTGVAFTIVNLAKPEVFIGALCGAALVFLFTSLTIRAVGKSAQTVIEEVRRQFNERPGIMDYSMKPDYARCVTIVTRSALIQMILPGLLSVFVPTGLGFLFRIIGNWYDEPHLGAEVSAGFLMVSTITGILMALFLNNAGGSWDNAKKLAEMDVSLGGKGSDIHKATVIGDTIGDPFKDTAGPSLHVLIKLLATITLVVGPLYVLQK
jgi:Na+/H+-translocating membrane pyrophosphatase